MVRFLQRILYKFCHTCGAKRSRTVRYAYPLIFTTISLIGAAVILPDDTSYVRITSNASEVKSGEEFTIDVYAGAHVPVNAVNIELKYFEDLIEIKSINTGKSVITIWTQEPYTESGKVILSGGTYRKGFIGEHLIASIKAEAKTSGQAIFSTTGIQFFAGDGTGDQVPADDLDSESLVILVDPEAKDFTASVSVAIYTDIDGDGYVSFSDISAFMSAWSSGVAKYDFNNDNRMTFSDFAIILADSFYK